MYETRFHQQNLEDFSFLVTGGAGFIGSNIVEYLVKYNARRIKVLDNLCNGYLKNIQHHIDGNKIEFILGDIRDEKTCINACEGVDFVLHQAALGSVPRSIKTPTDTNAVNVDGFLQVLNAAKNAKVKRFVYASSSSVYGDEPTLPKKEFLVGNPLSPYAVSKKVDELYANVFHSVYGIDCIGLRYFNIFGPNQSPNGEYAALIPRFIEAILSNRSPIIYGDGSQARDFTFVENAVQANIKALFVDNPNSLNQVYNVAVGNNTSVNQLFIMLKMASKSEVEPIYHPPRVGDIKDSMADIQKAMDFLDYRPSFHVEEGLRLTFEWYRKEFLL